MPKPPTKGGAGSHTQPKPAPINLRLTRLAAQATAIGNPNNQQGLTKELSTIEYNEEKSADVATSTTKRVTSTKIAILQPIVEALNKILDGEDSKECIIDGIFRYIRESEKTERVAREKQEIQAEVSAIRKAFRADLGRLEENLAVRLDGITGVTNVILETAEKALILSEEIKGSSNDIINKLGKVTNVADKIADTTQSYRDVLVTRQTETHKASAPPRILGDMERRAKQILIDIYDEEGSNALEKSLEELTDKANEILAKMSDADKPEVVKVEAALKTKKKAILLTLNSKEAAIWIREPGNEATFADAFSKGAHIREREYILVAPRVPLTFDPGNPDHLREIEETNALPKLVIRKARWIKPAERRRNGQRLAHATLTVTSVNAANKLIKDGLRICGSMVNPAKQKLEPIQCMKCRRWGHFADKCLESEDTCGTCGGKHRTSACENSSRLHCVSCNVDSHTSWDRSCPEFTRRCAAIDERNPVNSMPFFPAEQDWTLALEHRPSRIPMDERFPAKYAVNSLPVLDPKARQRRKGPHNAGKPSPNNPNPNPNLIPVPDKNRYAFKEPGELANDEEGIPEWAREPLPQPGSTEGDVTQQTQSWN